MARSSYVYVVADVFGPLMAFTVKRELHAWLKKQEGITFRVFRLRDAGTGPVELYYEELPGGNGTT